MLLLWVAIVVGIFILAVILTERRVRANIKQSGSKEREDAVEKMAENEKKQSKELEANMNGLVELNILVRVENFPAVIKEKTEKLIDDLLDVLPLLYEEFGSFRVNWEMNKIATEYLPQLCRRYSALSEEERLGQPQLDLEKSLDELSEEVEKISKLAKQKRLTEMDTVTSLLQIKYSNGLEG